MRLIRTILAATALTAASLLPATAQTTWNLANAYDPTQFHSEGYELFARKVEEGTKGNLKIVVHHSGSLFPNTEVLQATRSGLLDVGSQLMANLSRENPLWELDGIPFFATSYEDARKLWDLSRPRLEALLAESGLRLLFAAPWPGQGFFFKEEVKTLADVEGMTMRAYNPSTTRMAELMGATATTVQMTEVPQAFATGLIDAVNTSPTSAIAYKMWEFAPYYLKADAWLPKQMVFVREARFQALSPEDQQVVLDASAEIEEWLWVKSEELVAEAEKTLVDNGSILSRPEGQLQEELRGVGQAMIDEWLVNADDEAKAIVSEMQK